MRTIIQATLEILLYSWQLPQNLIGLLYLLYCRDRVKVTTQGGAVFYATNHVKGGVTLGQYVFISARNMTCEAIYDHEYGHVLQSKVLGPLWIFVIAIPSGGHCLVCRAENYYHFYTESWANVWGGIPAYRGEYHHHEDGLIVTCWDKLVEMKKRYF